MLFAACPCRLANFSFDIMDYLITRADSADRYNICFLLEGTRVSFLPDHETYGRRLPTLPANGNQLYAINRIPCLPIIDLQMDFIHFALRKAPDSILCTNTHILIHFSNMDSTLWLFRELHERHFNTDIKSMCKYEKRPNTIELQESTGWNQAESV